MLLMSCGAGALHSPTLLQQPGRIHHVFQLPVATLGWKTLVVLGAEEDPAQQLESQKVVHI
jgi:hypothetical protein